MSKKGFTIIEIIVAAFLLLTLLMVSTPLLYQLMRYQRDANNADDLNDNVKYLLMILEKELATGSEITSGTNTISFKNQYNQTVEYSVSNGVLTKKVDRNNDGDFLDSGESSTINSTNEFLITNIRIVDNQKLDLDGDGIATDSGKRHLITLFLQAESVEGQDGFKTKLPIQMSIIPRNQNLNN